MKPRIIVGTHPLCDIRLTRDEYASPRHCAIELTFDGWTVTDLGSTNGTMVWRGDSLLKPGIGVRFRLEPGDRIMVGRTELPVWDDGAAW